MSATKTDKKTMSNEEAQKLVDKGKVEIPEEAIVQEEKDTPTTSVSNPVNLSKEESHIAELVKEQPKDVAAISTKTLSRFNLLELPEECKPKHGKEYRFRWLNKQNIEARLNSSIWTLCTRVNSPYIKAHRFKGHGAVEQAGMLLAFATEELGKEREEAPAKKSAALVKHYTKDLPNDEQRGFYTPKDSGEEDDGEGLVEGKDF